MTFKSLGEATTAAQKNANRDQCKWYIRHSLGSYGGVTTDYTIADEFTSIPYPSLTPAVRWVHPKKESVGETISLTPDERALVVAVLDPKEPGREYYGGTETIRTSLWRKLIRK